MPLPSRPGRVGRGCRALTISHHTAEPRIETSKNQGPDHILSSIKFSKCELQPHTSRIPVRRVGSSESKTTSVSNNSPTPGGKDVSATMKVWKLLRPGLHRHLSLSGVSGKDGAIQLASKALMKRSTDRSLHYVGNTIIETAPVMEEALQQVEDAPVKPCETVTLCGEA